MNKFYYFTALLFQKGKTTVNIESIVTVSNGKPIMKIKGDHKNLGRVHVNSLIEITEEEFLALQEEYFPVIEEVEQKK